jgi:Uncharacterized protein conserved in bacteria (DUF2188)
MVKKKQHVVPFGNGWAVKGEGNSRFTAITERKAEATIIAKQIARNSNSEIVIHRKDGRIMTTTK